MPEAARIDDEISHTQAGLGHLLGSIAAVAFEAVASYAVGYALAGLACIFPFGTLAAIVIGVAVAVLVVSPAADFIQSTGEAIGKTYTDVTGTLVAIGSSNVLINKRRAIRAHPAMDHSMCSRHSMPPSFVIEGAERVWINTLRASRKGDAMICDAKITSGSGNVFFGTPPIPVAEKTSLEVSENQRKYAGWARMAAGILGGSAVGIGKSMPCFLANVAVGTGMALASGPLMEGIMPKIDYGTNAGNSAGTSIGNWLQGKPVHVPTGAKILPGETDIYLPGAFPIVWARFYNSMDDRIGLMGQGWGTPLSFEMAFRDGKLIFIGEQGRENAFDDIEPNESRYDPAEQLKISRTTGGHYYASYPGDDLIYYFGKRSTLHNGERLHVQRVMDLRDNGIDFHYNAEGLVHEMISSSGQVITLHYSDRNVPGTRLFEIRQLIGLGANDNRRADEPGVAELTLVQYGYNAEGDLISVMDRSGAVVREFGYHHHMMVQQQFATGLKSYYKWDQLNAKGRVVKNWSDDGEALSFEYLDRPLPEGAVNEPGLGDFSERLVRVTDQLGRVQAFTCDRNHLVTRFVDPLGATTTTAHDANKRIVCFTDAEGHQTRFSYDSVGQLAAIHNALGQSASVKWHPKFARISSVMRFDGTKWFYTYDDLGSLVEVRGPNGFVEHTIVDERGLAVIHTDSKGGSIALGYNDQAQLTRYTDCSNKTTQYVYNELGRLIRITDAVGSNQLFSHDGAGRLIVVQLPDGAKHQYHYDASGLLIAHTNGAGKGTRYARNIRGEVTVQENAVGGQVSLSYDAAFRLAVLTNENNQRYQFVHDAADRLIEEHRVDGTRVTVEYDQNGQPIAITQHATIGDDAFTQVEIEGENRADADATAGAARGVPKTSSIRTELIRDALGRLIEKRAPSHHYHYRYDAAGRLIEARKLYSLASTIKPLHTTRFSYDALGNLTEETATDEITGEAHTLTHAHDQLGNRTQTVLPALGPLTTSSEVDSQRALNYLYYGSGHLHQINLSQQSIASQGNEAVHQLIADIERDDLHREILRTQGGLASRYAYDALSRRTGAWTRASGLQSRPFSTAPGQDSGFAQALAFPSAHEGLIKHYSYDLSGELRQRNHTQQGKVSYGYDALGRVESAQRSTRGGHASSEQFRYDPSGNLLDNALEQAASSSIATDSNGNYANYSTQGTRRGYVHDNLVRVFEDKRYRYDGFSRLLEKRVAKHTVQRFEWDDEHRLIAVHTTRLGYAAEREAKTKPGAGNNAGIDVNPQSATKQTIRFDYDAIGRRVAKHDAFGSTRFIWEGMRLIEERRSDKAGKQSGNVVTYVYEPSSYVPLARIDADGQLTDAGGVGTTSDDIPAPVSADQALKQQPLHEDHSAAANDDWEALQPNESRAYKQARGSSPAHPANVYYFHTDQVGLPEELSDQHGQIRWRAAYKTWGNTVAERWEAVNLAGEALNERAEDPKAHNQPLEVQQNLRFQGQYLDRESGLHYNTFRFYDPDIGRFISPDPIGLNGGLNLTSYAPNPNVWIDPWGWACASANDTVTRGPNGQVQTVKGTINPADIGTGTTTNASSRAAARALGTATDDAGHMRGNNLGGSGGKANTFPQDPHVNRGGFQIFEGKVADHVQATGKPVNFEQTYQYGNGGTRPTQIDYTVTDPSTGAVILQDSFPN
jgi:RHS repeat-associated protein